MDRGLLQLLLFFRHADRQQSSFSIFFFFGIGVGLYFFHTNDRVPQTIASFNVIGQMTNVVEFVDGRVDVDQGLVEIFFRGHGAGGNGGCGGGGGGEIFFLVFLWLVRRMQMFQCCARSHDCRNGSGGLHFFFIDSCTFAWSGKSIVQVDGVGSDGVPLDVGLKSVCVGILFGGFLFKNLFDVGIVVVGATKKFNAPVTCRGWVNREES